MRAGRAVRVRVVVRLVGPGELRPVGATRVGVRGWGITRVVTTNGNGGAVATLRPKRRGTLRFVVRTRQNAHVAAPCRAIRTVLPKRPRR